VRCGCSSPSCTVVPCATDIGGPLHTACTAPAEELPANAASVRCGLDKALVVCVICATVLSTCCVQAELEHDTGVNCVCQSSDNSHVVSGTRDGQVNVWDPETLQTLSRRQGHWSARCFLCLIYDV